MASFGSHLSRPSVMRHGVEIRGEAVVQGEHTLYLIVESADDDRRFYGTPRVSVDRFAAYEQSS